MEEIWKPIKNYEGLYEISNFGKIRSLDRTVPIRNSTKFIKGSLRKPQKKDNGYLFVILYKDSKSKNHYIHRLVAKNFIDNPSLKETVNHIDGNKENNNINNLEWSTRSENSIHGFKNGLCKSCEKHYKSKLTNSDVLEIKNILKNTNLTQNEIANIYGVTQSTISAIKLNKKWKNLNGFSQY